MSEFAIDLPTFPTAENADFYRKLNHIDGGIGKLVVAGTLAHAPDQSFTARQLSYYLSEQQAPESEWSLSPQLIASYRKKDLTAANVLRDPASPVMQLVPAATADVLQHTGVVGTWQLTPNNPYIEDVLGDTPGAGGYGIYTPHRRYAIISTLLREDNIQLSLGRIQQQQKQTLGAREITTTSCLWSLVYCGILEATYTDSSAIESVTIRPKLRRPLFDLVQQFDDLRAGRNTETYRAAGEALFEDRTSVNELIRLAGVRVQRVTAMDLMETQTNILQTAQQMDTFNVYELFRALAQGPNKRALPTVARHVGELLAKGKIRQLPGPGGRPTYYTAVRRRST